MKPKTARLPKKRSLAIRLFARMCQMLIILIGIAVVFVFLIHQGVIGVNPVNEEIRARIETKLKEQFPQLSISLASARIVENEGIELRNLRIVDPSLTGPAAELAQVAEILAECDPDWSNLLSGDLPIHRLRIRGLRASVLRRQDGSWSLDRLLPLPEFGSGEVITSIENAKLQIFDLTQPGAKPVSLYDINITITPESVGQEDPLLASSIPTGPEEPEKNILHVHGSLASSFCQTLELREGKIDLNSKDWSLQGSLTGLEISPDLLSFAPLGLIQNQDLAKLARGRADLTFELSSRPEGDFPFSFLVSGQITRGRFDDKYFPYQLSDMQADVYCDNHFVRIENLSTSSGDATLLVNFVSEGYRSESRKTLNVRMRKLALDQRLHRLVQAMPESFNKLWRDYSPQGVIDADLELTYDGQKWTPELKVECRGVSFAFHKFPFRIHDTVGSLSLKNDVLKLVDLRALASGQQITFTGEIDHPGPQHTGWVEIELTDPIPLNEDLLAAMTPKAQKVVRSLHPNGMLTFWGRIERDQPAPAPVQKTMKIGVTGASIRYEGFPYPVEHISGLLKLTNKSWEFINLQGRNDSGYITCDGNWQPTLDGGGLLRLDFDAQNIPLEEELRRALKPGGQRVWLGFRPRGSIDHLTISIQCETSPNRPKNLSIDLLAEQLKQRGPQGGTISIEPTWFPYRMENVYGSIRYTNGFVTINNVSAQHGQTTLSTQGVCETFSDGAWSVRLDRLTADRLHLDHQLAAALPGQMGLAISKLNLSGPVNMSGPPPDQNTFQPPAVELAQASDPRIPLSSKWDMSFYVADAALDCGLRLDHLHGGIHLIGKSDAQGFETRGELDIDSVIYKDMQFTKVTGPLLINQTQILFGAKTAQPTAGRPPRSMTANVFQGKVEADAIVSLQADGRWLLEGNLAEANLADIAKQSLRRGNNISGKVSSFFTLSGDQRGSHTLRGKGKVRLRNADIYELPVMLAMLNIINVKPPNTTAFTDSDIDFRIQGEDIYLDQINFTGDVISLKGNGWMNKDFQIDMRFYTQLGRNGFQIPLLRPLFTEASQQFLLIEAKGPLSNPHVVQTAFPGLNEVLQQIFPDNAGNGGLMLAPREVLRGGGLLPKR